jgi:hypothetical protein
MWPGWLSPIGSILQPQEVDRLGYCCHEIKIERGEFAESKVQSGLQSQVSFIRFQSRFDKIVTTYS